MKKILTTLTLLITLCSFAFGQNDNHFGNTSPNGDLLITFRYATIYVNGELQTNQDIEVAAFIDDKLSGINREVKYNSNYPEGSQYYRQFKVFKNSNESLGNNVVFKAYNHDTAEELLSEQIVTFNNMDSYGTIRDPYKIYFTSVEQINPVAKVGNTEFNTLEAAVEAAEEGNNEITLLRNAEGKGIVIDKNITIDFNTFAYTFVEEGVGDTPTKSNGFQIKKDNYVTLKNGTLNVDEESKDDFYILIQNYSNLTVENMKLDGTNLDMWSTTDGDSYVLSNNSGNVNVIGTTKIIANKDGDLAFALDACYNPAYTAPVVTLGENVIVEGKVELTGGQLYTTNKDIAIVAKKHFDGVGDVDGAEGWGTISTPIANVNIPANENHDLYMYEEKTAMWRYYTNENGENADQPFSTFELGQGYLYANKEDITIELTGTLNVAPVSFDITYTTAMNELAGFNFVGNPFAHNISEAHFATTGDAQLSNGFYVVSPTGAIVVRPEDAIIAPMESVMVQTNAETTLTINNVASESKRSAVNNGRLEITVANANYSDVAYVSFNEGRGLNKIGHRNVEIPMVYIPVDGANYAIAMMNQDVTEIPVSFQAATMGQYTIGVEAQDCEYAMMTLVDRFTGIETNLLLEDYTFIAKSNDSAERFIIKLAMDNSNGEANENFAFINNGMMYIYNIEGQGTVSVYDVTGRPVAEYNVATSANISTSDFAAGMYIIRMSDENGVKVQKIVVE